MPVMTTSADVPPAVATWFDKDLLLRVVPNLPHSTPAQRRSLKGRAGNTIKFRRFEELPVRTAPLVEGIPPTGLKLTHTDVTAQVVQHGSFTPIADLITATIDSPIMDEAMQLNAEQAARTLDVLKRDEFNAGTNVIYANGSANRAAVGTAAGDRINPTDLSLAIRTLNRNNAKRFKSIITATDRVATQPVRPAFIGIIGPDVLHDMETLGAFDNQFIPMEQYASQGAVMDGEVGHYKDIRFLLTSEAKSFPAAGGYPDAAVAGDGTNADVHTVLIFAMQAVGDVPLDNMSLRNIIKTASQGGTSNPLEQYGTVGWKRTGTEVILNDNFLVRLEVAVSA